MVRVFVNKSACDSLVFHNALLSASFDPFSFLFFSSLLPPALSAIHALEKHRHGLISRSRLLLHVLRLIGSAASALRK